MTPDMVIERLLDDVPTSVFVEEYYLKVPFSQPGGAREFVGLGCWETVQHILDCSNPDVLVVREGKLWSSATPPSYPQARELYSDGYTIAIRHAERHHPDLAKLGEAFQQDFQGAVDLHVYCTPKERYGFGWHYDAEDVFVLQAKGSKEYLLRKNTVNPWPVKETLPRDMRYERELMPLLRCRLVAGDWLYIPGGYWHMAKAGEESISLAVGVMSTTALEMFDFLRQRLLGSLKWRQRLPTPGQASPLSAEDLWKRYKSLCAELAEDLAQQWQDEEFLRAFLASKGVKHP